MPNSGTVASGAQATAAQYNNLRADALDPTTGHDHTGAADHGVLLAGAKAEYGDGSDGDVTISGSTSLARDMFYNNLTVNAGQTLWVSGWRIHVKGTLTLNGTLASPWLTNSGQPGGNPPSGAGYGKLGSGSGQAGAWQPGNGNAGAAFTMGGIGGKGGDCTPYTASAPFQITGSGDYYGPRAGGPLLFFGAYMTGNIGLSPMSAGMGGGGGACSNGAYYAGGGGHGGGWVMVFARRIVISATGAITARGGNGAAGTSPGPSAGGGGGSGGCIVLTYDSLSNAGSVSCPGGSGGAGYGTGQAGSVGGAGVVMYLQQ